MTAPGINPELIFGHTVEALFERVLRGQMSQSLRSRLKALGFDPDARVLPAYPFPEWLDALEAVAAELYPKLTPADAALELGKKFVVSYQETVIGKALFAALRVLSTRRIIGRMARNFRTSNNFTEVIVRDIDPQTVELDFNLVERQPTFTQGILAAGLPAAGVKGSQVSLLGFDGRRASFRITWTP